MDTTASKTPELKSNVFDTALIFEGGGMRGAYSAGTVNTLLENGIYFDNVYGVSAGASHTVNYVSRNMSRSRESFVDIADDPQFGGILSFLKKQGIFNASYIFQELGLPDGSLPYDFAAFQANPAHVTIQSFSRDTGEDIYWTKDDFSSLNDLMVRVRASSSLPILMPATPVDGRYCYDGGLGEGAGLVLHKAMADGFTRFFIVRTRPKAYRKVPNPPRKRSMFMAYFWNRPYVVKAINDRWYRYNALCEEIEELEASGDAYVVYADNITCSSGTDDVPTLQANYDMGYEQAQRELDAWKEFLFA